MTRLAGYPLLRMHSRIAAATYTRDKIATSPFGLVEMIRLEDYTLHSMHDKIAIISSRVVNNGAFHQQIGV